VQKPLRGPNNNPVSPEVLGIAKYTVGILDKAPVPIQNVAASEFITYCEYLSYRTNSLDSRRHHYSYREEEKASQDLRAR
jgi:hypothetical protein